MRQTADSRTKLIAGAVIRPRTAMPDVIAVTVLVRGGHKRRNDSGLDLAVLASKHLPAVLS
jgi:hypothetical protein